MLNGEEKIKKYHSKHFKIKRIIGFTFIGIIFTLFFALIFGFFVQLLWNWLMPAIFGLGLITFWQAFGLIILAKLLFGGFGPHHGAHREKRFQRKFDADFGPHGMNFPGNEKCFSRGPMHMRDNWKYYHRFWQEEGKDAFNAYMDKVKKDENDDIK